MTEVIEEVVVAVHMPKVGTKPEDSAQNGVFFNNIFITN